MAERTAESAPLALFRVALDHAAGLALFRPVLEDDVGRELLALVSAASDGVARPGLAAGYGRVFSLLAARELRSGPALIDAWQDHLLDRILDNANPFTLKAERAPFASMGPPLVAQTARDLRALQSLYALDAGVITSALAAVTGEDSWVHWAGFHPVAADAAGQESARFKMKQMLATVSDWGGMVEALAGFYHAQGAGDFGRFRAFRWVHSGDVGRLEGVATPDPIRLDDLVGYEREREPVVHNTEQFVAGYSANNVLVFGEQGTGKSSTVKALLNAYADRGLRLVEVAKDDLADFPGILAVLRDRPERFILFVDDLSFEEQETNYKALKAILEGGIEVRPENVLLYATSNRRHLVKERFADRTAPGEDEVHVQDTMEEKLSLAARFGLRVTFVSPGQERFLLIVTAMAEARRLNIGAGELRQRAIAWTQWQNGRSGRTARQFIDHLTGDLALQGRV